MYELLGNVSQSALALRSALKPEQRTFNPHIDRIVNQLIDLPKSKADESETIISESLHEKFWANAENRKEKLEQAYRELSEPEDLIVMICCKNFCLFLELWLSSCEQNGISVLDKTLIFVLDSEAELKVMEMGFKSYLFDPQVYLESGGSKKYGDQKFRRTMFYKNAAVFESLKLGANILFQDVDLVWLKDPFVYLKTHNQNSQIQIMYDGVNPRHYPYYANTGFFYLKNDAVCQAVFETALCNTASIFRLDGHQPPFNRICHHFAVHNLLNLTVLPQTQFINGHLFNANSGIRPAAENWQTEGFVIHYSWTANREDKLRKLRMFNYFNIENGLNP